MSLSRISLAFAAMVLVTSLVRAMPPDPTAFASDPKKEVLTTAELTKFLNVYTGTTLWPSYAAEIPIGGDGLNDPVIEAKVKKDYKAMLDSQVEGVISQMKPPYQIAELRAQMGISPPAKPVKPFAPREGDLNAPDPTQHKNWNIFVRKSSSLLDNQFSVKQPVDDWATIPADSNGALVSYAKNFTSKKGTFMGQGVVEPAIRLNDPKTASGLQDVWLIPSVGVNYYNGSGVTATQKLDSFEGGLGLFGSYQDGGVTQLLRVDQIDQSDIEFKSLIVGGQLEYEVQDPTTHLGDWVRPWQVADGRDVVVFCPRLLCHIDGGHVYDPGTKTSIHAGEDYARIGPRVALDIEPGDFWDIKEADLLKSKIQLFYGHYAGLIGKAADDYGVNLHLALDPQSIFSLDATYEYGGLNANGDRAHQITVGLSIVH